jgi:DNA-binding transcriptional MerR regulator
LLQEVTVPDVAIPNRALFKPSEVCEIARVQPYVLRSWESEFPDLGVAKAGSGQRVYRRVDVERVLRIKQLVFADGLTLAGVRRRIEEEQPTLFEDVDTAPMTELRGRNTKERLTEVKRGLQAILQMLSGRPNEFQAREPQRPAPTSSRPSAPKAKASVRRSKPTPRKASKVSKRRR